MQLRTFVIFVAVTLMGLVGMVSAKSPDKKDPISGEWIGKFEVQGNTAEVTFELKVEGETVTGKLESEHTGPGILNKGTWMHNKVSFTAEFAKHPPIEIDGTLKDGKLMGEFHTEGMVGKWEATKK